MNQHVPYRSIVPALIEAPASAHRPLLGILYLQS